MPVLAMAVDLSLLFSHFKPNKDMVMNKLTLSALALLMTLGLAACSQDDNEGADFEEAGDNIEDMADDAGDSVEETYEDATGQNDSAWDETKDTAGDAAEETGEAMDEAGEEMGEAAEEAGDSMQ